MYSYTYKAKLFISFVSSVKHGGGGGYALQRIISKKIGYYVTTHFTQILGTQKVVVLALLAFLTPLSGLGS